MKINNETFVCLAPCRNGRANIIIHKQGESYQVFTDTQSHGVEPWPDHLVWRKRKLLDLIIETARRRIETAGMEIKLYGIAC